MSVHVGEMHTDVRPAPAGTADQGAPVTGVSAEEAYREASARLERMANRTASEAFDD